MVRPISYILWHLTCCSGHPSVLDQYNEDIRQPPEVPRFIVGIP